MRPHRLWITAFGSFPGEEEVDFDALAGAGLFLIHGPTGAGKTTVLDALCYALYGRVPGKRDSAKSLRCDHAPPGKGPSVRLEVTIRGRRLKISRSPAWQRPKLRGAGTTRENEKALVQELAPSGEWVGLTTRVDEAGDLIATLLGMNADQFFQVAMLPQGDFARFLRADGEERRKVLERLFSVRVYAAVESWLAERRTEAYREQQALRKEVDFAVKRLEEAAGPALLIALAPENAAGEGGAEPRAETVSAEDDPLGWAAALEGLAAAEAARVGGDSAAHEEAVRQARERLERGTALADRRRRRAEALARWRALEETEGERAELEAALAGAARAERVLPLIQAVGRRAEAAAKAQGLAADAVARALSPAGAGGALGRPAAEDVTPEGLAALARDRQDEIGRLGELRAQESRLLTVARERESAAGEIAELVVSQAEADARLELLPGLRRQAEARLSAARLDAARLPAAEAARKTAAGNLRAAERRDALAAELEAARRDLIARLSALPVPPAAEGASPEGDEDAGPDGAATGAALASREGECREELAGLEGLRADEARLAELTGLLAALDAELEEAAGRQAALRRRLEELPAELEEVSGRLAGVRARTAEVPAARARADAAAATLDAVRRRDALRAEVEAAREARAEAVDHAQRCRDRYQDLRRARIDGMAAELAAKLLPGEPCAVCGSPDHPAPAAPAAEAPTAADERAARLADEEAAERRRDAESAAAALASRLDEALASAGELTAGRAEEILSESERELADLVAAAEGEAALAEDAARVTAELEETRARTAEVAEAMAEDRARRAGWLAERDRLTARLDGARGADPTVQARRERLAEEVELLAAGRAAAARLAEAATGHREACSATDLPLEVAARELEEAEAELAALRESAEAEPLLAAEVERIGVELGELEERSRELAVTLAARRTDLERLAAEADRLTARLDAARGEDPTLAARLDRLSDEAGRLEEAVEAVRRERAAAAELEAARIGALAAAVEEGFQGVDDALAAVRSRAEREEKSERLHGIDTERAAVAALLADPELIAAAAEPEPDLGTLEAERDAAEAARAAALSARDGARARRERLAALRAELAGCLERWLPAMRGHRLTEGLAALTGGTSADNRWNMRLSAYVLGERLRQVVEAANGRLDQMSGGRYLLEHNLGRSAGDRSRSGGGLGLRILDGWTGTDRDPATLSGGESFVASLALALGLADVVTAEAGGVELGTLFVDEGFGTLDEETLDGVLDILDGLRDGGRAVGIVSHVPELRTRVPARLRVRKERGGSTLSVSVP